MRRFLSGADRLVLYAQQIPVKRIDLFPTFVRELKKHKPASGPNDLDLDSVFSTIPGIAEHPGSL